MATDNHKTSFGTQHNEASNVVETEDGRIVLLPEPTRELLNDRQRIDYRNHREQWVKWLLNLGKNPDKADGYAYTVSKRRAHDTDVFYRYVWSEHADGYTTTVTHEHANAYMKQLAYSDYSETHKSNVQKSLMSLFRWRDDTDEWDPEIKFSGESQTAPRDYLTREERTRLREAALEYDSIPAYSWMSPEERDRWREYLAYRLDKPLSDVRPADFEDADGYKFASMVCVSLDCGLRPVEVGRAKVQWVDTDNAVLRIPKEESSKNRDNWIVSLRRATAELLQNWLLERRLYDKYDDTDALWLTRHSNPYGSSSLSGLLERLADVADIDTENRSLTWYSLRHSVGTYMSREEGLAAAQAQLRHRSIRTTVKYDAAPIEDRRDALDRMG
ncbi:integrase [Haloferax sp. Atlit-6N]|uniref:tyrosine-type recombinase/integrase n=1 Tax=Haloferax sp. Atlit-6N TaxID=2077205 RepID=UPI000E24DF6F|nr:site-specific integrase [Haloferax sp. Atlit-6N]REA01264.1 integrase [Haloferax sp. Atlit-6N]